ncbi:ArsR/SmtB family transcription factor [Streptomyces griseoincarnatus]
MRGDEVALRIHFTRDDLLRVSLGDGVHPLHETVLSLRVLQRRRPGAMYGSWQRWARRRVPHSVHPLRALVPPQGGCPDFLTPPTLDAYDVDVGVDALLHTPKQVLRSELREFTQYTGKSLPSWAGSLAEGCPQTLEAVGGALRDWHRTAIAPMQPHLRDRTEAARSSAARILLGEGLDALLSRLHPTLRWTPPVLELARPDVDGDLRLRGRGLRLIPSLFCGRAPVVQPTADVPLLMFPVCDDIIWTPEREPDARDGVPGRTAAALLGPTRAMVLLGIAEEHGPTTTELARRTGVSQPTVSHHTTVLRDSGLISTHRSGTRAYHLLTPLGARLVGRDRGQTSGRRAVDP